jgi:predicted RNase H-like nuclease (RuvC/YqgF family)
MTPAALRNRLLSELEQLDANLGIESNVDARKRELAKIDQDIARRTRELTDLERTLGQVRQEKDNLETLMSEEQDVIRKEFQATAGVAKEAVSDFQRQLLQGIDRALQEVQKLQVQVFEVGQEAGKLQGTIEANEWLRKLLSLVKGDHNLQAIDVRAVAITTLMGTKLWLQQNADGHTNCYSLSRKIDNILQELQEWKL